MGRRVHLVPLKHRGLHDALQEGGFDTVRQHHPGIAPSPSAISRPWSCLISTERTRAKSPPNCSEERDLLHLRSCCLYWQTATARGLRVHQIVRKSGIYYTFVPAACTDRLQPLDLTVNHEFKAALKVAFHQWYSNQAVVLLEDAEIDTVANVNLHTWTLKPVSHVEANTELIVAGFRKAGLC